MARFGNGERGAGRSASVRAWLRGVAEGLGVVSRRSRRDPLGKAGEDAAARFLRKAGYRVLGRNLRSRVGEADLVCVAPDKQTIVVVEVKSRRVAEGEAALPPEAAVTAAKRAKLIGITRAMIRANRWEKRPVRIDVVAVEFEGGSKGCQVRHFEDAVRGV